MTDRSMLCGYLKKYSKLSANNKYIDMDVYAYYKNGHNFL